RITGAHESFPGFIDNPTLNSTDFNTGYRSSARASLLFKPTDALSFRLTAFTQRIDSNGNGAIDVVGAARQPRNPQPNRFNLVNGFRQPRFNETIVDNSIQTYSLDVTWDLGWATLQSLTSRGRLKTFFTSDITSFNAVPGLTNGQAFAPLWPVPISIRQQQAEGLKKFNQEVRLSSSPGKFEWQGGIFYSTEDTVFNQFYDSYPLSDWFLAVGGPPIGGSTQPVSYEEWAVFGEGTYKFTDRFDLSLGLRHTDSEQTSVQTLYPGLLYPRFAINNSRVEDKDTTYSLSPRFTISDDVMVYARIATGFRPGGPLFAQPPAPQFYTSDQTVNYEAGFRGAFFDGRLTADLAAYHIDWTDIQVITRVTINNITYTTVGNAGTAESQGLEWNIRFKPIQDLTFGIVGAYTDATLTENAPSLGGRAGDQLPYVPKLSYSLNADYAWPAFGDFEGYASGTYSFVDSRYGDFSTAATATNHDKLPGYSNVNIQVGLRNERYTLQAYVNNLTNEVGILNYSNEGGANQSGFANVTTPRTIGVLLQARF
ncbi:TonB-dependent receptor, partial [Aphanothece microscopica]|uniref:TonB-dependent receptor n=1 Tax=Aphanothece microscopica TaxID=1049561 RepID=UPI003984FFE3